MAGTLDAVQIEVESGWGPAVVSSAGAEGTSQFMPATWPSWDQPPAVPGPDTPFVPPDAIMAQGRHGCALSEVVSPLASQGAASTTDLVLAAYNAGPQAVLDPGGVPPSSRALPTCPAGPPGPAAAPLSSSEPQWAVHPLGHPAGRLPGGLTCAQISPGAAVTYYRPSITPTFVCDRTLADGLKRELRRSDYRFAARVPGGTLRLRSAQPASEPAA